MSLLSKLKHHGRTNQQDSQHTPGYQLWRQPLAALILIPWPLFFLAMGLIFLAVVLVLTAILSFVWEH